MSAGGLRGRHEAAARGRQRSLVQQLRPAGGHQLRASRGWCHRRQEARLRHLGQHRQRGLAHGLHRRHGQDPGALRNCQGKQIMLAEIGSVDVRMCEFVFMKDRQFGDWLLSYFRFKERHIIFNNYQGKMHF